MHTHLLHTDNTSLKSTGLQLLSKSFLFFCSVLQIAQLPSCECFFFFSWTVEGLTSYCCGYEREKGRGRTTTHFFFSKDFTSRTLRSFVQLQTSGRRGQKTTRVRKQTGLDSRSYLCRALAVQYLRFLSGSLTWPSRQHWPQTNFIFRLRGRPLPAPPTSPPTPTPPTGPTPPATTPSPPPRPAMPPAGRLLPGWDMWIGWKRQRGFILLLQTIVLTHVTDLIHSTLIRMLSKFNKPKTFNHLQIIFFPPHLTGDGTCLKIIAIWN